MARLSILSSLLLIGCTWIMAGFGYPPEAGRDSAPKGVKTSMTQTGKQAPSLSLKDHMGKQFDLNSALKKGPVGIIFYRGYW